MRPGVLMRRRRQCVKCKEWKVPGDGTGFYYGDWMCSSKCMHDAGDRSSCRTGKCSCTGFSIKRRRLREHRAEMRVMEMQIDSDARGLEELEYHLENAGIERTCLDYDSDMDAEDDQPDPEQDLRDEATYQSKMVEAATAIAEARQLRLDLERARMEAEDLRARFVLSNS